MNLRAVLTFPMISLLQAVNDVGDMDLKRTLEEIKRLQAEANSLKRENIQLKVNTASLSHLRTMLPKSSSCP